MSIAALTLTVPVAGGKLAPSPGQERSMTDFLRTREGKAVTVKLSRPTANRTLQANAYYWGVALTYIAAETGHTTEEIHLAAKELFLPRKFVKLGNREVEIRKTTVDLTTTEFNYYLEQVRAWASTELGLLIPDPNQ